MNSLSGPDEVVEALHGHAYARFSTAMAAEVAGLAGDGAVLWWGTSGFGRLAHAFGEATAVARLVEAGRGRMGEVRWINMPRPAGVVSDRAWDFRWTTSIPAHRSGHAVVPVEDDGEINAMLDAAFPDSSVRPGHPLVIGWHGSGSAAGWRRWRRIAAGGHRAAARGRPWARSAAWRCTRTSAGRGSALRSRRR